MGWRMSCRPLPGLKESKIAGEWLYVGETENENLERIKVSTILYSIAVKFLPMHILPPNPKGRNPILCLHPPYKLPLNLSGLNSFASSPHSLGSWCMATTSIHMLVPFGIKRSFTWISSLACLCTLGDGG